MPKLGTKERTELVRWLDHKRAEIKRQRRAGRVDPTLIGELGSVYQELESRSEYEEALSVVEVAFQGLRYVKHPRARRELSYKVWRSKGVTSLWLGRHDDSIEAYEKAIGFGEKGAYAKEKPRMDASNRRELGSIYWRVGDHSEALRNLSIAEGKLERDKAAIEDPEYLDELARIRAAFGLVYLDLGRYTDAAENAAEAARIHEALGAHYPLRYVQAAIAYTTLGNAHRDAAQELEADLRPAFAAFDNALRVLEKFPSKDEEYTDRESDIYLGRGRALLLETEYETAFQHLKRSLSLVSDKNIAQHAAAHYLYLGEAQAKSGRADDGETSLRTAAELAESYGSPETRWRALYELALLQDADGRTSDAQVTLEECIGTIEGLRAQYLPEPFKISMLAAKEKAYEALVKNLCQFAGADPVEETTQAILKAFGYAEAAKSRVFAEQLATTDLGVLAGVPNKLLEKEHELTRELRVMRAGHLEASAHKAFDWGEEVARIEGRLKKIRADMRRTPKGEEYVSLREARTPNYSDVRAILNSDSEGGSTRNTELGTHVRPGRAVLAAYFVTEEEVFVFVGSPDLEAPRLHRIALARHQLRDWAFAIENTDADDLESWHLERWQRELGPLVERSAAC